MIPLLPKTFGGGVTAHDRSGNQIVGTAEVTEIFGMPVEISTEAEMNAELTDGKVGAIYKYTGTTGTYQQDALYILEATDG